MKFKIQTNKKISVKQRNVLLSLFIENISFISTDEGITKIHFKNNENPVFTTRILKEFEEELYEFGFVRVRSNFLVNIYFVKSINGGSSKQLSLLNAEKTPISRRNYSRVKEILASL